MSDVSSVALRSGERMSVSIVEPPLTEYARRSPEGRLVNWLWGDIKDEVISGEMRPWLYTPYAVGEIGPELVGSLAYYTSTHNQEVGLIQFVETAEAHRSKGIMSALMSVLIEKFNAEGGLALMLCTGNPIAGSLYEKHGFWYTIGDGLRYLAPGADDFEESFFAHNGAAHGRGATFADLPYAAALYNHSEPDWLVKDHLTKTFRDMRYESHFVKLMRRIEDERGGCLVLENPKKRVVGLAAFERMDTYQEQHVAQLSFRVCPAYFGQARELLDAAAAKAAGMSIGVLQVYAGERDGEQADLLREAGFSEEGRYRRRLRDGDDIVDMLVFTRRVSDEVRPARPSGDYYGARNPWMLERIAGRVESGR